MAAKKRKVLLTEAEEKLTRRISAETLIDPRTVRKWIRGEKVMRANADALNAAYTNLT